MSAKLAEQLEAMGACKDRVTHYRSVRGTRQQIWEACDNAQDMMWVLCHTGHRKTATQLAFGFAHRAIVVHAANAMDAAGLQEQAAILRAVQEIDSETSAWAAWGTARAAAGAAWSARDAAGVAWGTAWYTAWASWSARDAAGVAERVAEAARNAAQAAAGDAAGAAEAARTAARDAAEAAWSAWGTARDAEAAAWAAEIRWQCEQIRLTVPKAPKLGAAKKGGGEIE